MSRGISSPLASFVFGVKAWSISLVTLLLRLQKEEKRLQIWRNAITISLDDEELSTGNQLRIAAKAKSFSHRWKKRFECAGGLSNGYIATQAVRLISKATRRKEEKFRHQWALAKRAGKFFHIFIASALDIKIDFFRLTIFPPRIVSFFLSFLSFSSPRSWMLKGEWQKRWFIEI